MLADLGTTWYVVKCWAEVIPRCSLLPSPCHCICIKFWERNHLLSSPVPPCPVLSCELLMLSSTFHCCLSLSILTPWASHRRETPQLSAAVIRPSSSHLVFIISWQLQPYFPVSPAGCWLCPPAPYPAVAAALLLCMAWGLWAGVFSASFLFFSFWHLLPFSLYMTHYPSDFPVPIRTPNIIWQGTWSGQSLPLHSRSFSVTCLSCCVSIWTMIPLQQKIWLSNVKKKKSMKIWAYEHVS